jgi:hypothetical protein
MRTLRRALASALCGTLALGLFLAFSPATTQAADPLGDCTCSDAPTTVLAGGTCVTQKACQPAQGQAQGTTTLGSQVTVCRAGGKNTTQWQAKASCGTGQLDPQFGACYCSLNAFSSDGRVTGTVDLKCAASEAECTSACERYLENNTFPDKTAFQKPNSCRCTVAADGAVALCKPRPTSTVGPQQGSNAGAALAAANPLAGLDARGALGRVIRLFTGLVGSLALLMYVYGGFIYLTAGGDDKRVASAMDTFKWTTIGLVTVFASYAAVNQLFSTIDTQLSEAGGGYPDIYPLGQNTTPADLAGRIIRAVLGFSGVIALLMFMWGGWQYFASQGDPKASEQGRKTLINAVIGVIVIFTAYSITQFVIDVIEQGLG